MSRNKKRTPTLGVQPTEGFRPTAFRVSARFFRSKYSKRVGTKFLLFSSVGWTSLLYHFSRAHGVNTRKIRQVAKATRHHQKHPFQAKKEIRRGEIQKICKGFFWLGAAQLRCARRRGSEISFLC